MGACVRGKMRDWRQERQAGEASFDRVRHRRPSSNGEALKKRSQFADECGGDLACVRGKMMTGERLESPVLIVGYTDVDHLRVTPLRREPSSWRSVVEMLPVSEAR